MRNVLLVAPTFMNLYSDIIHELKKEGYQTFFIEDMLFDFDTRYKHSIKFNEKKKIEEQLSKFWETKLKSIDVNIDFLLVINGFSICPYLFEWVSAHHVKTRKVYYIWDKILGNVKFEQNFEYFDDVYCFDPEDAEVFNIKLLHNFWVNANSLPIKYKVSGFGSYKPDRFLMFQKIRKICNNEGISNYIKIYIPSVKQDLKRKIKNAIMNIINSNSETAPHIYNSDIVTHEWFSPTHFRHLIAESEIIIDSHYHMQHGLTPRFMWALGLGKKIITTNKNVIDFVFYNPEYIYIIDDDDRKIEDFINCKYVYNRDYNVIKEINKYRIDNWLSNLINGQ